MSFDGIATYAAVKELKTKLQLGKIEKIYQPQPEQLLLIIHTKQGKQKLFMSAGGNHSAVYLSLIHIYTHGRYPGKSRLKSFKEF